MFLLLPSLFLTSFPALVHATYGEIRKVRPPTAVTTLTDLHHRNLVGPYDLDMSVDCAMRNLSWQYALHLLPTRAPLLSVFDALRLSIDCNYTRPSESAYPTSAIPFPYYPVPNHRRGSEGRSVLRTLPKPPSTASNVFYADAGKGSDANAGTESSPFATPAKALAATRAGGGGGSIILRGGTPFNLPAPLILTPQDSSLSISAYPGEAPVLSGGVPLTGLTWTPLGPAPGPFPGPINAPVSGTLLLLPSGSPCVSHPGDSSPGVCIPGGQLSNATLCAKACVRSGVCTGYTSFGPGAAGGWAGWCYFRVDGYSTVAGGDGSGVSGVKPPPSPPSNSTTLWVADLTAAGGSTTTNPTTFSALFFNGRRATRARFPNGNPETDIEPNGYTKAAKWSQPPPFNQSSLVQINPLYTNITRGVCPPDACSKGGPQGGGPPWAIFCCFFWGWNATAVNFTDGSFWACQPGPPGGGTAQMPGGMIAGDDLAPRIASWTQPTGAIVHAFHGSYWGDWAWETRTVDAGSGEFVFEKGGWQEARGAGQGDSMYVENIREELDAAGEWFVDGSQGRLYVCVNGTSAPSADGWVAGVLDNLVTLSGTYDAPIQGVSLAGLTFEFSTPTFMEPFTVASGGDWSFRDGGAVRLSGTLNCSVSGSLFVNLGGTGVMLSGWNRGAAVVDNEFLWLGESGVMSVGLSGGQFDNSVPGAPYGESPTIARNLAHEIGLFVKQTGFYYQGMTANATVVENVFFNGPRAGININDGFGGGHDISRNVGFNMVRFVYYSVPGVFNSWDRNTYQWHGGDSPSAETLPILMDRNLFTCNYRAYFPTDNDDGSNSYVQTNNFLLWGGSKTLMGYNKHFVNNTFVYVDYAPAQYAENTLGLGAPVEKLGNGYSVCATSIASSPFIADGKEGYQEQWWNNSCIASSPDQFFNWYECNVTAPLDGTIPYPMKGNAYYSQTGDYRMHCRGTTWNFTQAQALGIDLGSTIHTLPTVDELVAMGHDRLQF